MAPNVKDSLLHSLSFTSWCAFSQLLSSLATKQYSSTKKSVYDGATVILVRKIPSCLSSRTNTVHFPVLRTDECNTAEMRSVNVSHNIMKRAIAYSTEKNTILFVKNNTVLVGNESANLVRFDVEVDVGHTHLIYILLSSHSSTTCCTCCTSLSLY